MLSWLPELGSFAAAVAVGIGLVAGLSLSGSV